MRKIALPIAAAAALIAPASASAATTWVVKGGGFGHGIGMSQYGSQGYAQHGWNYRDILAHYYTGTQISQAPTKTIRVLLRSGAGSVTLSHISRAGTKKLDPAKTYIATRYGAGVQLRVSGGRRVARTTGALRVRGPGGYVRAGSNYRGSISLTGGGGVTAVNVVGLDDYVQGVIPGEMPPSWMPEALKVQAVAARSYALTTDAGGALFDQYADTRSQMYRGMSAEQPSTNAAAHDTAGEVVTYNGEIATTFYFSTSGGSTENVENVWQNAAPSPYLRGVEDPYDDISPRHRWQFRFTTAQMKAKLGGLCRGSFKGVKVLKRGVSPRVVSADVVCSGGRTRTGGATLRTRLGLYDSWLTVTKARASASKRPSGMAGLVSRLLFPRAVVGSFDPKPRSGMVDVERRQANGSWKLVAHGLVNRRGAYRVPVYGSGTYRVRAGDVAAAPVTLR